jgi:NAD(P)-dependent dehydrogenase (short-subunit alcohol dehydrogenase family)
MHVAVITGASEGLGLAITRRLVDRAWTVVVDARRRPRLEEATHELALTGRLVAISGDVCDPEHRAALLAAVSDLGHLDLLVHNASALGPSPLPSLAQHPLDALAEIYATNVIAPVALTQLLLPGLLRAPAPTVVMVSSDAAVEAYPGWGGYGSSKAALDHIAAVLAVEQPDLRAYAFDPGDMRTAMHQRAFPFEDISDRPAPDTVVPALERLLDQRPASGRYRAADLLTGLPA